MAAAIFLFGAQLRAQLEVLTSQLQAVEQTVARYFDIGSVKELLNGSSLGAMFARALSWGTMAIAVVASFRDCRRHLHSDRARGLSRRPDQAVPH
jgi:hypothetical protein